MCCSSSLGARRATLVTWMRLSFHEAGLARHANTSETHNRVPARPARLPGLLDASRDVSGALAEATVLQDGDGDAGGAEPQRHSEEQQECPDHRAPPFMCLVQSTPPIVAPPVRPQGAGSRITQVNGVEAECRRRGQRRAPLTGSGNELPGLAAPGADTFEHRVDRVAREVPQRDGANVRDDLGDLCLTVVCAKAGERAPARLGCRFRHSSARTGSPPPPQRSPPRATGSRGSR